MLVLSDMTDIELLELLEAVEDEAESRGLLEPAEDEG